MRIPKFEARTEWVKPTEFPDLRQVDEIAIDLETKDPDLIKKGSGAIIGHGHVIGIAVATSHYKGYFPIAHEGGGNMDRKKVLDWLKDILDSPSTKIFHNAMYDVCWLRAMGFKINGDIVCTMIAAAVTDENRFRYDLNSLSWHYLGYGKNEAELAEAAREWGIDPKGEMYKLPAMHVGAYAERDAEATLGLWQELKKEIVNQDLEDIF
jgi:DNA polymerase I-like protein with 3'-5' exonuclease and polymerase domains